MNLHSFSINGGLIRGNSVPGSWEGLYSCNTLCVPQYLLERKKARTYKERKKYTFLAIFVFYVCMCVCVCVCVFNNVESRRKNLLYISILTNAMKDCY